MRIPIPKRGHCIPLLVVALISATRPAAAQHVDILVQNVDDRVATGNADRDSGAYTLGKRVYSAEFGSSYSISSPGFNALGAASPSLPPGASALPGSTSLRWDFLPMKIDGVVSNLSYWDGAGSTEASVDFGHLPGPDYHLDLYGHNGTIISVDGSSGVIPGSVINNTAANGSLHEHRYFYLDSDDQVGTTPPADGIYLMSLRLKMSGLDSSAPIYMVFGTPGSTLAALRAAESWVTNRVADLAPDFSADFNDDFVVDGADFLIWQRNLGAENALLSSGDADRDGIVGPGDLAVWGEEFGLSLETFPGVVTPPATPTSHAVPEPSAALLSLIALAVGRSAFCSPRLRQGVKQHYKTSPAVTA